MRIYIFSKATPEQLPPIIALSMYCIELGYDVQLITQNTSLNNLKLFQTRGISVQNLQNNSINIPIMGKIQHWLQFRYFLSKKIKEIREDDIIWVSGADTLLLIGKSIIKRYRIIFQLNELCDELIVYRFLLKRKMRFCSKVVVPEENRSYIAEVLYNLDRRPFILPNKPYNFDNKEIQVLPHIDKYISRIKDLKNDGRVLLVYQGYISDLRDLCQICRVVEKYKDSCALVLMGHDEGALAKYERLCSQIIHIPFLPAPWHLEVTALCNIGIMIYLPVSLNNIYCAPNKIWEYSKFGLAMLGNDIPGLSFINHEDIGRTVNLYDINDVDMKIKYLLDNHSSVREKSLAFYERLDMKKEILNILNAI